MARCRTRSGGSGPRIRFWWNARSRGLDFLCDRDKPFRQKPELGLGCERFYLTPPGLLGERDLPRGWGLLEIRQRKVEVVRRSARNLRTAAGFAYEMNLLLASLRRVEIRIEPQTITEFLKWKNRMLEYNGGAWPAGMESNTMV